jgi:hypothetical protein
VKQGVEVSAFRRYPAAGMLSGRSALAKTSWLSTDMTSAELLVAHIRMAFADVPFPSYCGLHAAMAMDVWVSDEPTLAEITRREDYIGEWWNVPLEHLLECMLALSYLDAHGVAFYLPAYMSAIVEKPESFDSVGRSRSGQVLFMLLPKDEGEDPGLKQYFLDRFSMIHGARKRACVEFLAYVAACEAYHEHAREMAKKALAHEFWAGKS